MSLGTLQCSRVLQFGNVCVIMILLSNKTSPKLNVFRCQLSIIYHASVTGWGSAGWDGSSVGLAVAASQGYMGLEYPRWFFFTWPLGWLCPFFCVASGPSICSQPDLYDNSLLFCLLVWICWGQLWLTSNSVSSPSHRHAVLSLPLWFLRSSGLGQELAPISPSSLCGESEWILESAQTHGRRVMQELSSRKSALSGFTHEHWSPPQGVFPYWTRAGFH